MIVAGWKRSERATGFAALRLAVNLGFAVGMALGGFIADWIATKPGSAAMTAPNPNSDAVPYVMSVLYAAIRAPSSIFCWRHPMVRPSFSYTGPIHSASRLAR